MVINGILWDVGIKRDRVRIAVYITSNVVNVKEIISVTEGIGNINVAWLWSNWVTVDVTSDVSHTGF